MGNFSLRSGDSVGTWQSRAGSAEITVKNKLGSFPSAFEARKAIAKSGEQGVVTLENQRFAAYSVDDGAYLDDLDIGDTIKAAKGLPVIDFVNDSAESLGTGLEILPPTGADNGKVVRVFMSYDSVLDKAVMRTPKQLSTSDDLSRLRELGYTVMIDPTATKAEYLSAVYDPRTAGVLWFGHGGGGGVVTHDQQWLQPGDINPKWVSPQLKLMVFESCQVGKAADAWQQALPGAQLQAWDKNVRNYETTWFNSKNSKGGLADLIETQLGGERARSVYTPPSSGAGGLLGGLAAGAAGLAGQQRP